MLFTKRKKSEVVQSCPTLCDPMDRSLPGSSVHGILHARILEWVSISFSGEAYWPRDRTQVSHTIGRRFPSESPGKPCFLQKHTIIKKIIITKIKLFSCVWLFATPWTTEHQASLSFTSSWSLLKLMSIELVMLSNHLVLCHPLLLPSVFLIIRVFFSELAFPSGSRSTGASVSASTSAFPMNQDWFPLGLTGLISIQS